jgi:hypothetical protein
MRFGGGSLKAANKKNWKESTTHLHSRLLGDPAALSTLYLPLYSRKDVDLFTRDCGAGFKL